MKISSTIIIKIIIPTQQWDGQRLNIFILRCAKRRQCGGSAGGLFGGGMVGEPVAAAAVVVDASPSLPAAVRRSTVECRRRRRRWRRRRPLRPRPRRCVSTFVRFGHVSTAPLLYQYHSRASYRVHSHSSV